MNKIKKIVTIIIIASLIISTSILGFALESENVNSSITKAIEYFSDIQNDDAGFPIKAGEESSVTMSCWAMMALYAAGEDLKDLKWTKNGKTVIDYIEANFKEIDSSLDYAKLLMVLSASNSSTVYEGVDIADLIKSFQQVDGFIGQDSEEDLINVHMWNILALISAGEDVPNSEKALQWLTACQNEDGGFGFAKGLDSDVDDTGIALQVMVLLGQNPTTSQSINRAKDYILSHSNEDGGFSTGQFMQTESNTASTAWALQALYAINLDDTDEIENHAVSFLIERQSYQGYFDWKEGRNASESLMTAYVLMALEEKPFPINLDYTLVQEMPFNDVDYKHWSAASVLNLSNEGIVNGYPDGYFKPKGSVSRAEFTAMTVKAFKYVDESKKLTFEDVTQSHWAYNYILKAYTAGIINGRNASTFDPNGKITGGELVTMMTNIIASEKSISIVNDSGVWYKGNETFIKDLGLLYPTYDGNQYATREECAYSIEKLVHYMKK